MLDIYIILYYIILYYIILYYIIFIRKQINIYINAIHVGATQLNSLEISFKYLCSKYLEQSDF